MLRELHTHVPPAGEHIGIYKRHPGRREPGGDQDMSPGSSAPMLTWGCELGLELPGSQSKERKLTS